MKQTITKTFFGEDAIFFKNGTNPKIIKVQTLDRERSAVEITIEVEK